MVTVTSRVELNSTVPWLKTLFVMCTVALSTTMQPPATKDVHLDAMTSSMRATVPPAI